MSNPRDLELALVGLGTMGMSLLLNMADHGNRVAGFSRDADKVASLAQRGAEGLYGFSDPQSLLAALRRPRVLMLLVPAGSAVDEVIAEFAPLLQRGDFIVDAGNSLYRDTMRRATELESSGLGFIGMGVSGGESGARHGPSMMPGGSAEDYQRIRPVLESVAARYQGEPCVARMGNGAAGHYVKMIHNGIEYALMQMLAECYDLMKRRLGMDNAAMADEFERWNAGRLQGYLVEISATVLRQPDDLGAGDLLDAIADSAGSKGTGKWTSQDAMDLGVPVAAIDAAVGARALSALYQQRQCAATLYPRAIAQREDRAVALANLEQGYHAAAWLAYAQGMAQIAAASAEFAFDCDLASVARVWRAGCIIRAAILEPIRAACDSNPALPNLLLDADIARIIDGSIDGLRLTVADACGCGVPVPALSASLAWFDGYRSARLPSNLIQGQRDLFGAHTYRRVDREGIFHTQWRQS